MVDKKEKILTDGGMVDKEAEKMAGEPNIQWKSRGVCGGYKSCMNGGEVGFVASASVWTGLL